MMPSRGTVIALAIVVLLVPATSGCLSDDDGGNGVDYKEWYVAMTVERFDTNGERPVNVTYLLFEIRFGPILKDGWVVQQSETFQKEKESVFPLRIEARYDDKTSEVEEFPIMGSSNVVTGAVKFTSGRLSVDLDGKQSLYTIDRSAIDRYPHDHEVTVTVMGDYGDLTFYFNMNEPPSI
jgi:hypothetical protein